MSLRSIWIFDGNFHVSLLLGHCSKYKVLHLCYLRVSIPPPSSPKVSVMSLRSHPSLGHCPLSRIFPLSPLQTSNHAICRDQCNVNGGSLVQKEKEKKPFSFLLRPLSKLSLGFCAVIVQCQAPSGEGPVWTCTGAQVPPQICVWGLFS